LPCTFHKEANTFYSNTIQILKMSKKILVFAVLFTLALSMTITQEASALTRGAGEYVRTSPRLNPGQVCGDHICQPGENAKWSAAVSSSQRQGPGKATGAQYGFIIMHQMVVNYLVKPSYANQTAVNHSVVPVKTNMTSTDQNKHVTVKTNSGKKTT
jgi:hypothetical protein